MSVNLDINGSTYQFPESGDENYADYATEAVQALAGNALYPNDIVNDLTTGGAAVPLSAEQGKTLQTNKADDSAVVHDTGNETVAGVKTFSSFPVTPSEAPTTDYQVPNKKYVDDTIGYDDEGAFRYAKINGTKKKVYTKYFTGTLDASTPNNISHGVSSGMTKILSVTVSIENVTNSNMQINEGFYAASTSNGYFSSFNDTVITIGFESNLNNGDYRIRIDYIL